MISGQDPELRVCVCVCVCVCVRERERERERELRGLGNNGSLVSAALFLIVNEQKGILVFAPDRGIG